MILMHALLELLKEAKTRKRREAEWNVQWC